jgi:uncharacterized flavoprotein (TIGR03862 family)
MIAIVGSGPAALMAADILSAARIPVCVFEKRKSIGRKLLVAGSSGLNITNDLPVEDFAKHYRASGVANEFFLQLISAFPPTAWIQHIEAMGIPTFQGSTGRYFIEDLRAARFLHVWRERLKKQGVEFHLGQECDGFEVLPASGEIALSFADGTKTQSETVIFALGGASWEPDEDPLRWPQIFEAHQIQMDPFAASNVGYEVDWNSKFLLEAEGQPLKNVVMSSPRGTRAGEIMITKYGLEGTPVYFVGTPGQVTLDLVPDLSMEELVRKLENVKENWAPMRRIERRLDLCAASRALLFHHSTDDWLKTRMMGLVAARLKKFPLVLNKPRPLAEAISSSGGVSFSEVDEHLMLRKFKSIYLAGEMLSWDVPTGGFLIQGAVAQGAWVARHLLSQRLDLKF